MGVDDVWIGLNDRDEEGSLPDDAPWARDQPDDGGPSGSEDCVAVGTRETPDPESSAACQPGRWGSWADEDCDSARPFTCAVYLGP